MVTKSDCVARSLLQASRILTSEKDDSGFSSEIARPEAWEAVYNREMTPKFWKQFCDVTGHNAKVPLKLLGQGKKGVIYALSTGDAAKFTTDRGEVKTASYLLGLNGKYDKEILYDIKSLISALLGGERRWIIIQEKLEELPGGERGRWGHLAAVWNNYSDDYNREEEREKEKSERVRRAKVSQLAPTVAPRGRRNVATAGYPIVNEQNVNNFMEWLGRKNEKLSQVERDWFYRLGRELDRLQIEFADLHEGNIMWRSGGTYPILVDIGLSSSPEAKNVTMQKIEGSSF